MAKSDMLITHSLRKHLQRIINKNRQLGEAKYYTSEKYEELYRDKTQIRKATEEEQGLVEEILRVIRDNEFKKTFKRAEFLDSSMINDIRNAERNISQINVPKYSVFEFFINVSTLLLCSAYLVACTIAGAAFAASTVAAFLSFVPILLVSALSLILGGIAAYVRYRVLKSRAEKLRAQYVHDIIFDFDHLEEYLLETIKLQTPLNKILTTLSTEKNKNVINDDGAGVMNERVNHDKKNPMLDKIILSSVNDSYQLKKLVGQLFEYLKEDGALFNCPLLPEQILKYQLASANNTIIHLQDEIENSKDKVEQTKKTVVSEYLNRKLDQSLRCLLVLGTLATLYDSLVTTPSLTFVGFTSFVPGLCFFAITILAVLAVAVIFMFEQKQRQKNEVIQKKMEGVKKTHIQMIADSKGMLGTLKVIDKSFSKKAQSENEQRRNENAAVAEDSVVPLQSPDLTQVKTISAEQKKNNKRPFQRSKSAVLPRFFREEVSEEETTSKTDLQQRMGELVWQFALLSGKEVNQQASSFDGAANPSRRRRHSLDDGSPPSSTSSLGSSSSDGETENDGMGNSPEDLGGIQLNELSGAKHEKHELHSARSDTHEIHDAVSKASVEPAPSVASAAF